MDKDKKYERRDYANRARINILIALTTQDATTQREALETVQQDLVKANEMGALASVQHVIEDRADLVTLRPVAEALRKKYNLR